MSVLITGAGGSIGSELARQVADDLVLVDRCESALFAVGLEVPGELRLANVVNRRAMRRLITEWQPDTIYHVAACKHVPMMESHPSEAVQVNIGGTLSLLDAADEGGVSRFVFVSTDKAVAPVSVMGATKRIGEWLVAERARTTGRPYVSVRFGNVIGTAGSVIETFRSQLSRGLPLTITHPDASRYFMSVSEAVSLIILAGDLGGSGTYVLDMGEQRTVREVADELIREAGFDPATYPVAYTGLRPGEKLTEALYHAHETSAPAMGKVQIARGDDAPPDLDRLVAELLRLADGDHDDVLRECLMSIAADPDAAEYAA